MSVSPGLSPSRLAGAACAAAPPDRLAAAAPVWATVVPSVAGERFDTRGTVAAQRSTPQEPPIRATLLGTPPGNGSRHQARAAALPIAGNGASTSLAAPHRAAAGRSQEPLAQAIGVCWQNLQSWWREMQLSPGARFLVMVLVVFVLMRNLRWLLPLLTVVGFVYVPYYIIRQMLIARHTQPSSAAVPLPAQPSPPALRRAGRMTRASWRQLKRAELASKRASSQLAELAGSWLAAAITAVFCGIAAAVIGLRHAEAHPALMAPYTWMMVVAFTLAVVILGLGKLWEVRDGDPLNRRLVLAGCGGLLGALAYLVANHLLIPLDSGIARSIDATTLPPALYQSDGTPRLAALMTHFAILMAAVRWWKVTDPLRRHRLSVWTVAVVVVADWLIHQLVPIPQPWGMLIAGSAVIAVQIAAAWESPEGYKLPVPVRTGEQT
jgi:hypothetical protein